MLYLSEFLASAHSANPPTQNISYQTGSQDKPWETLQTPWDKTINTKNNICTVLQKFTVSRRNEANKKRSGEGHSNAKRRITHGELQRGKLMAGVMKGTVWKDSGTRWWWAVSILYLDKAFLSKLHGQAGLTTRQCHLAAKETPNHRDATSIPLRVGDQPVWSTNSIFPPLKMSTTLAYSTPHRAKNLPAPILVCHTWLQHQGNTIRHSLLGLTWTHTDLPWLWHSWKPWDTKTSKWTSKTWIFSLSSDAQ